MANLNCGPLVSIDAEGCVNNIGGLEQVAYFWLSSERVDLAYDESDYVVDSLEYVNSGTASTPIFIKFHKDTATFNESKEGNAAIANETNTVTLTIQVNNRQYDKSKSINILGAGQREIDIVFSQRNGTNWFIPNATLKTTNSDVGATRADGSFYTLTFETEVDGLLYGIEDADLDDLISNGKIEK